MASPEMITAPALLSLRETPPEPEMMPESVVVPAADQSWRLLAPRLMLPDTVRLREATQRWVAPRATLAEMVRELLVEELLRTMPWTVPVV